MHDHVADVLAQRATLDRGAGAAIVLSIILHGGLAAVAAYGALRMTPPKAARVVNIQFARMPAAAPASPPPARVQAPPAAPAAPPKIQEPEPKIVEPKPQVTKSAPEPEKNTVPLSPFGRSTKKGSERPAAAPPRETPAPAPALGGTGTTTADVPVGGTGVTGLEGGDFPFTLYIDGMQRRIGSNWFRAQVASGTTTVIYFRILRDGSITDARVATPSGNATFDRAALSAVRSSNPLNPLPPAYNGNYLGVHLTFR